MVTYVLKVVHSGASISQCLVDCGGAAVHRYMF